MRHYVLIRSKVTSSLAIATRDNRDPNTTYTTQLAFQLMAIMYGQHHFVLTWPENEIALLHSRVGAEILTSLI